MHRREHEHPHRPRAPVGADAGDLAGPQPRQLRPRARLARGLGHAAAIELRRALLDPRAAVGALRDVRRHLCAAALADEVEVGATRHEGNQVYAAERSGSTFLFVLRRRGGHDVLQELAEVAVRLVHLALPVGAVAVLEQVGHALELVGRRRGPARARADGRRAAARAPSRDTVSRSGRSTSSPSSPCRDASHLFSSSISYG